MRGEQIRPAVTESKTLRDGLIEALRADKDIEGAIEAVSLAKDWKERLKAIRALYEAIEASGDDLMHIDTYSLGIDRFWTPIEERLWQDIRGAGINMLPQYPVGPYFVDFGDPSKRIAIEADGKEFHDRGRDSKRDADIFCRLGWSVFRVSGAECYRIRLAPHEVEEEKEQAAREYYLRTSSGVVDAIRFNYYDRRTESPYSSLISETLRRHSLVPGGSY